MSSKETRFRNSSSSLKAGYTHSPEAPVVGMVSLGVLLEFV